MSTPVRRHMEDPVAGAAEFLMRLGIAVLMIAGPVGALVSRRLLVALVPVGAALMIASVLIAPRQGMFRALAQALASPLGIVALALLVWIGASILWTPYPGVAGERFAKMIGTAAVVTLAIAILPTHVRTPNLNLLPIGLGAACLGVLILAPLNLIDTRPIEGPEPGVIERVAIMTAVLLWPALGALAVRDRWMSAGVLAVVATAAILLVRTPAAFGGLAAGAIVCAFGLAGGRRFAQVLAIVFAILFAFAPALALLTERFAPQMGIEALPLMRSFTAWAGMIAEHGVRTLTGYGFDSAVRGLQTGFIPFGVPRGAIFQMWFDLGVFGALLMAFLLARVIVAAGAAMPPASGFLLATVVSTVAIGAFSAVGLQLWWLTIVGLAAIASALLLKGQYRTDRPAAERPASDRPVAQRPAADFVREISARPAL
ncbi:MAG: hypothetical protein Q8M31_00760 [Beijerinckiaceae bacterium]|nr:hypothetical protein [Beijerinckiaceae bacterium]